VNKEIMLQLSELTVSERIFLTDDVASAAETGAEELLRSFLGGPTGIKLGTHREDVLPLHVIGNAPAPDVLKKEQLPLAFDPSGGHDGS